MFFLFILVNIYSDARFIVEILFRSVVAAGNEIIMKRNIRECHYIEPTTFLFLFIFLLISSFCYTSVPISVRVSFYLYAKQRGAVLNTNK